MDESVTIRVKNRPLEHYILNIYSLILGKIPKFRIVSEGKSINNAINLINVVNSEILPGIFSVSSELSSFEKKGVFVSRLVLEVKINDTKFMPA